MELVDSKIIKRGADAGSIDIDTSKNVAYRILDTLHCQKPSRMVKVVVTGSVFHESQIDHRFCLWVNDLQPASILQPTAANYRSFSHAGGDYPTPEWEYGGFYLGRSGWHIDNDMQAEYNIASHGEACTGSGLSTFATDANQVIGYRCHGVLEFTEPIESVTLAMTTDKNGAGTFSGAVLLYQVLV